MYLGKKAGLLCTHHQRAYKTPVCASPSSAGSCPEPGAPPQCGDASVVRWRQGTARGSRAKARPHSKDKLVAWTLIRSRATGGSCDLYSRKLNQWPLQGEGSQAGAWGEAASAECKEGAPPCPHPRGTGPPVSLGNHRCTPLTSPVPTGVTEM